MLDRHGRMGHWTALLAFSGAAMTTMLVSANTLAGNEADAIVVAFEEPETEPQRLVLDEPASSTAQDFARSSNVPALPVDANNPSRRCGNVTMMLDMDDLCRYARSADAMASPQR